MGLTLLEASKYVSNPQVLAVIREFSEGELMGVVPFRNLTGSGLFYNREEELPAVGFRGINETLDDSYGVINPQSEALKLFGSEVDVDKAQLDMYGPEARANQIEMKVRAMRMAWERTFIKGDEQVDPREFDGLQTRLNEGSSQVIDNGGGGLSLSALDELVDECDAAGGQKYLIMSKKMRRLLTAAARDTSITGIVNYEQNNVGRMQTFYGDVPILLVDKDNNNRDILGFDEGTGADMTSIYCVSFGDTHVTGLQGAVQGTFGSSVKDLGEVQDAPVYRTRIEWYTAMACMTGRAAARLHNIADAAVVK